MDSVRDLITASLRLIEEAGSGEGITAEQAQDGFDALVTMLDSWSVDPRVLYTLSRENFALQSGVASYTIGSGAVFDTARPLLIDSAFIRYNGIDYPLEIVEARNYALISSKSLNGLPQQIYYDADYPQGTLTLYPVPDQAYQLHLYSRKPLDAFTDIGDLLIMPPGYARALKFNLAVEIAPEYGKQPPQTVVYIAAQSRSAIENANSALKEDILSVDAALLRTSYNIRIDQ